MNLAQLIELVRIQAFRKHPHTPHSEHCISAHLCMPVMQGEDRVEASECCVMAEASRVMAEQRAESKGVVLVLETANNPCGQPVDP